MALTHAQKQARYRAAHPEYGTARDYRAENQRRKSPTKSARLIRLGLVRQAIRSAEGGDKPMIMPEELQGLRVPALSEEQIAEGRERNLERARRRVEARRRAVAEREAQRAALGKP